MKRNLFLFLFASLCLLPTFADNSCKQVFDEALGLFHTSQYYDAKLMFTKISDDCGKNYKNVDAMLQLCNHKLKEIDTILYVDGSDTPIVRVLKQEAASIAFDVKCHGEYIIAELPDWCEVQKQRRDQFVIGYETNTSDSIRNGNITVKGGGQTIFIQLQQDSLPIIADTLNTDSLGIIAEQDTIIINDSIVVEEIDSIELEDEHAMAPLAVDMTSISAAASGTTEYIHVTSGKDWEIQYPSGVMYMAEKVGDYVRVKIAPNKSYSTRSNYFYIRTKDQTESIKITIYQQAADQSDVVTIPTTTPVAQPTSSSSTISSSYTSSSPVYMSAYDRYCADQGSFEVTWFGTNFSIGTGFEYSISALRLRWGWIQLNPIELSIGADFLEMMGTSLLYSYQPSLNFVIPASENEAVYIGAGPVVGNYLWFKAEAGYRLHWGENASSDIFVRYDGTVTIGVSIQCSSHN